MAGALEDDVGRVVHDRARVERPRNGQRGRVDHLRRAELSGERLPYRRGLAHLHVVDTHRSQGCDR
jgi:hypothetical protein